MNNPYLRRRTMEILRTDDLENNIQDVTLNELMSAFAHVISTTKPDEEIKMNFSSIALHYAQKLADNKFVVIRDPEDNIVHYVVAHGNDLVSIYYPLGPWYERYAAIASSESVLVTLGILTPTFTDNKIIDRVFRFPTKEEAKDVPTAVVDPKHNGHWNWHVPGVPKIPVAVAATIVEERNSESPKLETIATPAEPLTPDRIAALTSGNPPSTVMGAAFASMNLNQPRGSERRDGDRRGRGERRELAASGAERHHESPMEQVTQQAGQLADEEQRRR